MRRSRNDDFVQVEETGFWLEVKRNWLVVVIVLGLAGGAFYLFAPDAAAPPPASVSASWRVMDPPQKIQNFSLTTASGNVNRISDYYGRPKIIMGYQLECEDCRRSLITLDAIAPLLQGKVDIFPLAISTRGTAITELIQEEFKTIGVKNLRPYTIMASDAEGVFSRKVPPHTLVTGPNDMIVRFHNGAGNWNDPAVLQLLSDLTQIPHSQ